LWPDRLLASLEPNAVALARVKAGFKPRLIDKRVLDCDPGFGAEPWQGAVAALGTAMQALSAERLSVTVVLSNHFVRYILVPFDAAAGSPGEELALARFHFARVHGERANAWDVRVSAGRRGEPRLASALDAGLLDALRSRFPQRGKARLVSVQPYLMSAFNLWGREVSQHSWLLLVEPHRACCARLDGQGRWQAVQSARGEFPETSDWAALLEREGLRSGAPAASTTALVHAPGAGIRLRSEASQWKFTGATPPALHGYSPIEDGRLAMALCGL
jgi:hypothetical protein